MTTTYEHRRIAPSEVRGGVFVRPVITSDVTQLATTVGALVADLYPGGWHKLRSRLVSSAIDKPSSYVVASRFRPLTPIALASEADKGVDRRKLSTFWVAPEFRRRGVGSLLLDSRISSWLHAGLEGVSVTVRDDRLPELLPLFASRGFREACVDRDRYGEGKHEVALEWRPDWYSEKGFDIDSVLRRLATSR